MYFEKILPQYHTSHSTAFLGVTPCRSYQRFGGTYFSIFKVESPSVSHLRRPHGLDTERNLNAHIRQKDLHPGYYNTEHHVRDKCMGVTRQQYTLTFSAGGDVRR